MKKLILFFSIVILGATSVYAQPDLPNKCEVFYPEVLLSSSVLKEQDANELLKSSDYGQNKPPRNVNIGLHIVIVAIILHTLRQVELKNVQHLSWAKRFVLQRYKIVLR